MRLGLLLLVRLDIIGDRGDGWLLTVGLFVLLALLDEVLLHLSNQFGRHGIGNHVLVGPLFGWFNAFDLEVGASLFCIKAHTCA